MITPVSANDILTSTKMNEIINDLNAVYGLTAYKVSTETINNTAVLQNDDNLVSTLDTSSVYLGDLFIPYMSNATPDIKFGLTVPAGTTGTWGGIGMDTGGTIVTFHLSIGTVLSFGGDGNDRLAHIKALIQTGSTAGNARLQWAQNTQNASNTSVLSGAWWIWKKLA